MYIINYTAGSAASIYGGSMVYQSKGSMIDVAIQYHL